MIASALRPRVRQQRNSAVQFSPTIDFIKFHMDSPTNAGTTSTVPINFSASKMRTQHHRGEGLLWKDHWVDPEKRARLAERLRRALKKRERSLALAARRSRQTRKRISTELHCTDIFFWQNFFKENYHYLTLPQQVLFLTMPS